MVAPKLKVGSLVPVALRSESRTYNYQNYTSESLTARHYKCLKIWKSKLYCYINGNVLQTGALWTHLFANQADTDRKIQIYTERYKIKHREIQNLYTAVLSSRVSRVRVTVRFVSLEISGNLLKNVFFHFLRFNYYHIKINNKHIFDKQLSKSLCFNFLHFL